MVARNLLIEFAVFDSVRLPLPDKSVDRVVCLDAFHHVADQAATLREFYRVLKPGGRMAFAEPGPDHSRSPQSQHEMRLYGVIENDIVVEDIDRWAREIGFLPMEVAYSIPSPMWLDVEKFNRLVAGRFKPFEASRILRDAGKRLEARVFFLVKPGQEELDSRCTVGLAGEISVSVEGSRAVGRVKNTGQAAWLPSGSVPGAVNIGASLIGPKGDCIDVNFARGEVSTTPVPPGIVVEIAFDLPEIPAGCTVAFDLVAENVAWFFAPPLV